MVLVGFPDLQSQRPTLADLEKKKRFGKGKHEPKGLQKNTKELFF